MCVVCICVCVVNMNVHACACGSPRLTMSVFCDSLMRGFSTEPLHTGTRGMCELSCAEGRRIGAVTRKQPSTRNVRPSVLTDIIQEENELPDLEDGSNFAARNRTATAVRPLCSRGTGFRDAIFNHISEVWFPDWVRPEPYRKLYVHPKAVDGEFTRTCFFFLNKCFKNR